MKKEMKEDELANQIAIVLYELFVVSAIIMAFVIAFAVLFLVGSMMEKAHAQGFGHERTPGGQLVECRYENPYIRENSITQSYTVEFDKKSYMPVGGRSFHRHGLRGYSKTQRAIYPVIIGADALDNILGIWGK